jgi:hypothetical protein
MKIESFHSIQNILSPRMRSRIVKIEIQKTIRVILPVVLYECETWSLILREQHTQYTEGAGEQGSEKNI